MAEQIIPEHEIVTIPSDDQNLRQQCYAVRIDVFHHEQKFPLETEIDEYVIHHRFMNPADLVVGSFMGAY